MRLKSYLFLLVLAFSLLVAACSSSAPYAPAVAPQPVPTLTVRPAPTAVPTALTADVLVVYQKEGCLSGLRDTLTVRTNGALELVDRTGKAASAQVESDALAKLRTLLAQPAYAQLEPRYQASGADLCIYTVITRAADGTSRSAVTTDAATYPEILAQVIGELERLRATVK